MPTNPVIPNDDPLDPTLFAINWDVTLEVLLMIVVLSFLVERALAMLFESDFYVRYEEKRDQQRKGSFKSVIAFAVAALACYLWQFDAVSILLQREHMTSLGAVLTGAVVAGGSKASMKLFHDVFDAKSNAYRRAEDDKKKDGPNPGAPGPGDTE